MTNIADRAVPENMISPTVNTPSLTSAPGATCRFCGTPLRHTFVDLGMSPLCESFLSAGQLNRMEPFYPLHVFVCANCFLVQLQEYVSVESIFTEYAYFSSYSESWLTHAKAYTDQMIERFALDSKSQVVEVASNDGYLLQYFVASGVPALGIEPAVNVAAAATKRGVPTLVRFFHRESAAELAAEGKQADLLVGNNVLAQVPDVNSFVDGLKILLKPNGVITMEFPHLVRLIEEIQFDTIYHEHFSYLSLLTASRALETAGLRVVDVEELSTHGGSLRVHARPVEAAGEPSAWVKAVLDAEAAAGLHTVAGHEGFASEVLRIKSDLIEFLVTAAREGKSVAGYGAPGKGNTLLNHCGIRSDLLAYTVDRSPVKQGKFLPGTHIPIYPPERIVQTKPDYILVLPWNLRDEISRQLDYVRSWGGRLVFPIPALDVS